MLSLHRNQPLTRALGHGLPPPPSATPAQERPHDDSAPSTSAAANVAKPIDHDQEEEEVLELGTNADDDLASISTIAEEFALRDK